MEGISIGFLRSSGCNWGNGSNRRNTCKATGRRGGASGIRMWVPAEAFEFVMQPKVLVPSVTLIAIAASTRWFEYGPRKKVGFLEEQTFVVRVRNRGKPKIVELPNGNAHVIQNGEGLLKTSRADELFSLTRALEKQIGEALKYDVFRTGKGGLQYVRSFPAPVNASGGLWVDTKPIQELDAVWSQFFYLFLEEIDREWINYRDKMVLITENVAADCRLCGGVGTVLCSRCRGGQGECATCRGRRRLRCPWCEGQGKIA